MKKLNQLNQVNQVNQLEQVPPIKRFCQCKKWKNRNAFGLSSRAKDRKRSNCKECARIESLKYVDAKLKLTPEEIELKNQLRAERKREINLKNFHKWMSDEQNRLKHNSKRVMNIEAKIYKTLKTLDNEANSINRKHLSNTDLKSTKRILKVIQKHIKFKGYTEDDLI